MAKQSSRRSKKSLNSPDSRRESRQYKDHHAKKVQHVNVKTKICNNDKDDTRHQMMQSLVVVILATSFAFLNSYHQTTMFENNRHFSHLSTIEREMTFRTEMGLYYSYFKTLVEAPSLYHGIHQIMNDNLTEYPLIINTLERFNLYPEVLLGAAFRSFIAITRHFDIHMKECWQVHRGDDMPPIESCEGLGEPVYFYTMSVFLLNGLVGALIFLYGSLLSNSVFGGFISISCFFFNHGECTRVQWAPPLRESFGYPIFLLQMLIVTLILRHQVRKWEESVILGIFTSIFILFWQFAQFALLTQVIAVFFVFILGLIPASTLQSILKGQMVGLIIALFFLFGNKMLLSSFYASSLVIIYVISLIEFKSSKPQYKILIMVAQVLFLAIGIFGLKGIVAYVLSVRDDAHIWNILKSKFTSYKDFHTMLYTCAVEFDFLEKETYFKLAETLLLPLVTVVSISFLVQVIRKTKASDSEYLLEDAYVVYNFLQLFAFFIMAILVMRLKLFFTPHLCLMASLIASKRYFSFLTKHEYYQYAVVAVLISLMAVHGVPNIKEQRNNIGEYSNPNLEELFLWINASTATDAVFGGPMPTMANLLLSTRRAVVNHPHYENAELRNRTYQVYKIFSRKSANEVYNLLKEMKLDYVIIERSWCYGRSREGCGMSDLWDVEDQENLRKEPLCQKLIRHPEPFRKVFYNGQYTVLAL